MNIRDDFILKNIHEGYLVGGYIRDYLMGLCENSFPKDRDIAIKGANDYAQKLAKELDATFIILDSENKIYRLVLNDKENYIDISEIRADTIEEDLLMRDFTINSIAYDLHSDNFLDPTNGIQDIKLRKIRSVREENFIDDPLRILRGYRFMATTGFEIEDELSEILKKHASLINLPARERIHDEIMKLFGGNYTAETLLKMLGDGILELIFPQVKEMKKVPPNSHHHLDLIHHVIETVRQIEILFQEADEEVKNHLNSVDFGGYPRINHLKLAGFLHDIGKFSTWTIEEDTKRHRFIKHDCVGAKMSVQLLKDLKFSNKQICYISDMIKLHIYPSNVISAPNLDNKVKMRYIRKMEDNVIDNIILAKADRLSAQGPDITSEMTHANLTGLDELLNFYIEQKPNLKPLPKLLDGVEIMKILNIKPSPTLGKIILALHEAQMNGDVVTKDDAVKFITSTSLSP